MQTESASIMQRMRRKTFRYTLSENIPLPDGTGGAKSAICCAAMPYVTTAEVKNGVLSIEGIITLNCALRTAEPNALTFASQLPFLCETQYTGADADAADASVKCLSCTLMLTGGMLTAECVLELSAVPYTLTDMTIVSAAGEAEPVKRQRAIIVYFASANETRFDVAKRYSLPVSSIAAGGDTLCEGEKLTFLC